MVEAAVEAIGDETMVFAITVLTSMDEEACDDMFRRTPRQVVGYLASLASQVGAHGIVCSCKELDIILQLNVLVGAGLRTIVPGIRPAGAAAADQRRVDSPAAAVAAGADFLVVGRPITEAPDPIEATRLILEEMEMAQIQLQT
jgi:orotidine-5'-phosphate decarboxylase